MTKLVYGITSKHGGSIRDSLEIASVDSFDFVVVPLFHPRWRDCYGNDRIERNGPETRSDRELPSKEWISNVVGRISNWIDLDNVCEYKSKSSEHALRQQVEWALHLGLQAVLLPPPITDCTANYARCVRQLCSNALYLQLWMEIPLMSENRRQGCALDGWTIWNQIRFLVGHHHRLSIALNLSDDIPEDFEVKMSRWAAEPVKAIILRTSLFVSNSRGYPVLLKHHQRVVAVLMASAQLHVIFTGQSRYEGGYSRYQQYITHLSVSCSAPLTQSEAFTRSYNDTLQMPLQPLQDNLEAQTYETFERDPVKYAQYERAIAHALSDLFPVSPDEQDSGAEDSHRRAGAVVVVIGAGRGPLVAAALAASASSCVPVTVYAVEKNRHAVITLRNRVLTERWGNVTVVSCDGRLWQPPCPADVIVSELLGSWGDNELSPECLDAAQRYLRPGGINIPSSYTSFMAPTSAAKLWMGARDMLEGKGLDTPFVVKFCNSNQIAPEQQLFKFEHPSPSGYIDNSRHAALSFVSPADSIVHGFVGTFESDLYKGTLISIVPKSFSTGMFSWFPLFIPLNTPLHVLAGQTITVHVWRCLDSRKVWYEWCVTQPTTTPIQNSNGKSYFVGLH